MNHVVAIVGFSASGKDSVARVLANTYGYKNVISTTSRPMRSNEKNHIDYHFVTDIEFKELIKNDKLIEHRDYQTIQDGKDTVWHYGIESKEVDLDNNKYVVVVDLKGLNDLRAKFKDNIIAIFIDVDEEERRLRAIARDKNFDINEWNRRYEDDKRIFENIRQYHLDYMVENYNFKNCINNVARCINERLEILELLNKHIK